MAASVAAVGAACKGGGPSYPTADCHQVVWAQASAGSAVRVVGSWDGWGTPGVAAGPSGHPGWQVAILSLPPGEYGYQVVVDGAAGLDPFEPLTTFDGDTEVSLLVAEGCSAPVVALASAAADAAGTLSVTGTFTAAANGPALDPASVRAAIDAQPAAGAQITARRPPTAPSASRLRGSCARQAHGGDRRRRRGRQARASASAAVWVQPAAETWDDAVLYQIVTDRFRGDAGATLAAPPTPGTRAGGTLDGITAEIERGTFAALGVTALWISPLYTNPEGFQTGLDGHLSEGYHGYWVLDDRAVDPHLGGEAALDALIASAHAHGLRVLFDLVPNQVFQQNPRYLAHQGDGWFNDAPGYCICGVPGCDWSTYILTCWFDPWLPTVRFQSDGSMEDAVDTAVYWMNRFDADGVRIDAVPMMPRAATRRIVQALRAMEAPARAHFALGEVFTGGGLGGIDQIKYFLGPSGLDSASSTSRSMWWRMQDTPSPPGRRLHRGRDHPGRDRVRPRRLRLRGGAHARQPRRRPLPLRGLRRRRERPLDQPAPAAARRRPRLRPAAPGAGPDLLSAGDAHLLLRRRARPRRRHRSRFAARDCPLPDALLPDQTATLALARRLGKLRGCSAALRRGARVPVWDDADTLAFARDAGDGAPALALFSRSAEPTTVPIPGGVVPAGPYVDAISGKSVNLAGPTAVALDPVSFRILVPASSPCHP